MNYVVQGQTEGIYAITIANSVANILSKIRKAWPLASDPVRNLRGLAAC